MKLWGHILADFTAGRMKLFVKELPDGEGDLRHTIACSNATIAQGYGTDGHCPPGDYYLAQPQPRSPSDGHYYIAEGPFFTPLLDPSGLFSSPPVPAGTTRGEIGVHSGGSGSPAPLAPVQGLYPTEGCTRLYNMDNVKIFVPFVLYVRAHSDNPDRAIRYTVVQPT